MSDEQTLLTPDDGPAIVAERPQNRSPYIVVCEHAGNAIPQRLARLGLSDDVIDSHAGWDIGALALARSLANALNGALVYQRFSRLVYDCNRPPEASDAMPARSEVYSITANATLSPGERRQRIEALYLPFHAAIESEIEDAQTCGAEPIIVTIHSFTRIYNGERRDVDLGILADRDTRLADRLMQAADPLKAEFRVHRDQPYGPADGVTHTLKLHAVTRGFPNVMFEVANDLVRDSAGQQAWARRLKDLLRKAAAEERESEEPRSGVLHAP